MKITGSIRRLEGKASCNGWRIWESNLLFYAKENIQYYSASDIYLEFLQHHHKVSKIVNKHKIFSTFHHFSYDISFLNLNSIFDHQLPIGLLPNQQHFRRATFESKIDPKPTLKPIFNPSILHYQQ